MSTEACTRDVSDELDNLPQDVKDLLARFSFDEAKFRDQQMRIAAGKLSVLTNIVEGDLTPPDSDAWMDLPKRTSKEGKAAIKLGKAAIANGEVAVIILNGGMATRFGGIVKGTVEALQGRSFVHLKVQNVIRTAREAGGRVPVYVMNSFATDEATREHFDANQRFGLAAEDLAFFTQGISLRLNPDGSIYFDEDGRPSPHGPGHGDCQIFFRSSGLLEQFVAGGGKYVFISNVDNLAARLDPLVIGMHVQSGLDLSAELAPKWPGDQGGAPVFVDGKLWVVEGFRFPTDFDQEQVPVFNTNTFTVTATALDREFPFTDCYVEKRIDDTSVVQIETLIGELTRFLDTQYLRVKRTGSRSRFYPIKTPEDLSDGREDLKLICDY